MQNLTSEQVRQIPKTELLKIINKMKDKIRDHKVVVNMFKDYGVDLSEIDLIPIIFSDLDVSARTDHGIIYLNYRLLEDGDWENDDHYLVHELSHYVQQCTGTKPTKGAADGDYLDNEYEQEGFQNQTEYISDTRGDDEAEEYIDQVLDHHEVKDPKEREDKREDLLNLANSSRIDLLLSLAAFPNRKDIAKNNPDKTDVINKINEKLSFLGNKSAKYFGVVWDYVEKNNFQNIDERIYDVLQYIEVTIDLPEFDINVFNTFEEFRSVAHEIRIKKQRERLEKERNKEEEKMLGGVKESSVLSSLETGNNTKIFEDETNVVFRVNNVHGANALASDTTWCIARVGSPFYDQYTSSNLIFYFAIDKTRKLNDPYQKMSIRVMKDENAVKDIKATRKPNDGDNRDPEEVPGYEKFKALIIADAEKQPQSLLSKAKKGAATEEEVKKLWNNYFLASNYEKKHLLDFIDKKYYELPEIQYFLSLQEKKFTEEELVNINLKNLDIATLERIAEQTNNQDLLKKLYKLNYIPIQKNIAKKIENLKLLYEISFSESNDVIYNLVQNPNITEDLLVTIHDRGVDHIAVNRTINSHLFAKRYPLSAVEQDPYAIMYIKNPSEEIQLAAVERHGGSIGYIDNPTEKVKLEAVKQDGRAIQHIENPSEEMKLIAVKNDGLSIIHIENPTEEMQLIAVNENPYVIKYIENPSEEVQLIAVQKNYSMISYVGPAAQLEGLKQNGMAIRYIKEPPPTEEMKLVAVKQNGHAISQIMNPSEEVQLAAIRQNPISFYSITNSTKKVQLMAEKLLNPHGN